MHYRTWEIVLLGRLVGAAIIFGGIGLSVWNTVDYHRFGGDLPTLQVYDFLEDVLQWASAGLLVVAAAEIVGQVRPGRSQRRDRRTGASLAARGGIALTRVAGLLVVFVGAGLSFWHLFDVERLSGPGLLITPYEHRDLLNDVLGWLSAGMLIMVAAGIAERLRRRGGWPARSKGVVS